MFHQSKNALTCCAGPRLNLIPPAGLILLIKTRCAHTRVSSSVAGPLAICGQPMGDYSILRGASTLVKRPKWKRTLISGPGPKKRGSPTVKFCQIRYCTLKTLAWTVYKFNRGPGQQVKALLLQMNFDLKNRSFKTVDRKHFKYSSGKYLRPKASPNMLF
jgi:hypothetical protein